MTTDTDYRIVAWCDGRPCDEWRGADEVLARDAARELFARGFDVEVFRGGRFAGWVERPDESLPGGRRRGELSRDAQRALTHVRARTAVDRSATGAPGMDERRWAAAVAELLAAGRIQWTTGVVSDHPEVRGGYVTRDRWQAIPADLRERRQWVCWRLETRSDKPTKAPCQPDGRAASSTDPSAWSRLGEVVEAAPKFAGIGFVFAPDDPYCGLDFDRCVDRQTGEVHPYAADVIQRLGGYAELSPSGTGMHVIGIGAIAGERSNSGKQQTPWLGKFEAYSRARFFTMTGSGSGATDSLDQAAVDALVAKLLPTPRKAEPPSIARVELGLSDQELLERAFSAKNGAIVQALYNSSGGEDPSADDLALLNHLSFWTGPDPDRLDRLIRSSARIRDKWDQRHFSTGETYGERTIATALAGRSEFYSPSPTKRERYRDLLMDVLDDVPAAVESPAITAAGRALDDEVCGTAKASASRYRELLFAVLGGLPHSESKAIELARKTVAREHQRGPSRRSGQAYAPEARARKAYGRGRSTA